MDNIFTVKDKTGRVIYLTRERYKHILKHPDMQNKLENLKETITNAQTIVEYELEPDVKYYYRFYKHIESEAKYLRVVVKYLNGECYIITAYFVERIK